MKGWGAKKFGMSFETREIKLFGRDISAFCWDVLAAPEKFEKKKVSVQFLAPIYLMCLFCSLCKRRAHFQGQAVAKGRVQH